MGPAGGVGLKLEPGGPSTRPIVCALGEGGAGCRAPRGSQLLKGGEDSVRSRRSLATSWLLSPDSEIPETRVLLA